MNADAPSVRPFRQVVLSQEQLDARRITATAEPVPVGYPLVGLVYEPEELERCYGIRFQDSCDDLDFIRIAVLDAATGLRFSLIRHKRSAARGTEVHIFLPPDAVSGGVREHRVTLRNMFEDAALEQVTNSLGLTPNEIDWRTVSND